MRGRPYLSISPRGGAVLSRLGKTFLSLSVYFIAFRPRFGEAITPWRRPGGISGENRFNINKILI